MHRRVCPRFGLLFGGVVSLVLIERAGAGSNALQLPTADVIVHHTNDRAEFRIQGLDPKTLKSTAFDRWQSLVSVSVGADRDENTPSMLGTYRVSGSDLLFVPRFPLDRSISSYTIEIDPSLLDAPAPGRAKKLRIVVHAKAAPDRSSTSKTTVEAVFPSAGVLPENTLKFYIAFSAPMSRGGAYDHIRLLDGSGRPIADPFLELGEELWSVDGKRFTLLFDPGRIKRGLKPREEVGPVLEAGKRYTLVIDAKWLDAQGDPMGAEFRKSFRVEGPDEAVPDPAKWAIQVPGYGSCDPLIIRFPEPLDRALAERLIGVRGPSGTVVSGLVRIESEETVWKLTPRVPWIEGTYKIQVGTDLEDLAGNSVGRRFEVDLVEPITSIVRDSTVTIPFRIGR